MPTSKIAKKTFAPEAIPLIRAAEVRPAINAKIPPNQLNRLSDIIEDAESGSFSNPRTVVNKTTKATGYFQLVNSQRRTSAQSLLNRNPNAAQWIRDAAQIMTKKAHTVFVGKLTHKQQEALFLARLFETHGSDILIKKWINSGFSDASIEELYVKIHHTIDKPAVRQHIKKSLKKLGIK